MRPPRLKLRTLIVLVALATLGMGGVGYRRRAARYRAMAEGEASRELYCRLIGDVSKNHSAEFHARRRAAFLRCARYPWLAPPGEEPEPQ